MAGLRRKVALMRSVRLARFAADTIHDFQDFRHGRDA
jgi:hypothetical protein